MVKLIKIAAITTLLIFSLLSISYAEKPPEQIKHGEITAEEMFLGLMQSKLDKQIQKHYDHQLKWEFQKINNSKFLNEINPDNT